MEMFDNKIGDTYQNITYPHSVTILIRFVILFLFLYIVTGCSRNDTITGGTTETGNAKTVVGVITDREGAGISGAHVMLLPSNYNVLTPSISPDKFETKTDSDGKFRINSVDLDTLTLYATHAVSGYVGIKSNIVVHSDMGKCDTLDLQSVRVTPPQNLTLQFEFEPEEGTVVYIPGTLRHGYPDTSHTVTIHSLPSDTVELVVYNTITKSVIVDFDNVSTGKTCDIYRGMFSYHLRCN